ncbi:MAG: phosphatase PAP2 family protein [Ilumatobacteraceae bacterium]
MDWPTWDQAAVVAALCGLVAIGLRRARPTQMRAAVMTAAQELALMASLYSIWRLARVLPLTRTDGAIDRARQIDQLQHSLHMPTELSLQRFVLRHDWLAQFSNGYYAIAHVPALIAFLVWLFVRHRDMYSRWRNSLAILTAFCMVIRFVRVAPPRFLPDLGYIDLSTHYGLSLYGPVGTGVSDQFAAMPSIHVGWAAVVSFGIVAARTSRWRWLFLLHLVLTMIVVSATGNHWWLDGIVAVVLLMVGLAIDGAVRRLVNSRQVERSGDLLRDRLVEELGQAGDLDESVDTARRILDAQRPASLFHQQRLGSEHVEGTRVNESDLLHFDHDVVVEAEFVENDL